MQRTAADAIKAAGHVAGAYIPIETHGYPLQDVVPTPAPQLCSNCSGWKAAHMQASVGQCTPNSGLHPLMTTDRQSCSSWKPKT